MDSAHQAPAASVGSPAGPLARGLGGVERGVLASPHCHRRVAGQTLTPPLARLCMETPGCRHPYRQRDPCAPLGGRGVAWQAGQDALYWLLSKGESRPLPRKPLPQGDWQ